MKAFIIYIAKWMLILLVLALALDLIYTTSFKNNKARSVYQIIRGMELQKYDYIFLGSSRVKRHINHEFINKKTGLKGLNLGLSAAGPNEILLYLETFLNNHNQVENIYIEIGDKWNQEYPDSLASVYELPFLDDAAVYSAFKSYNKYINYKADIPFYRYTINSTKIGYRAVLANLFDNNIEKALKFRPYKETLLNTKPIDTRIKIKQNSCIDKIIALCKTNSIQLVFFTSPYLKVNDSEYKTFFKANLPNYYDFSNSVSDSTCYRDALHLNEKGANLFSKMVVDSLMGK
ncbi:MAG: hypothetical protein SGJ10_01365 [Bacteroidota bacterium]|nr:hypothetical protein [Bacteroidota bacterium]